MQLVVLKVQNFPVQLRLLVDYPPAQDFLSLSNLFHQAYMIDPVSGKIPKAIWTKNGYKEITVAECTDWMDQFSIEKGGMFLTVISYDCVWYRIILIPLLRDIQDGLKHSTFWRVSSIRNICAERYTSMNGITMAVDDFESRGIQPFEDFAPCQCQRYHGDIFQAILLWGYWSVRDLMLFG